MAGVHLLSRLSHKTFNKTASSINHINTDMSWKLQHDGLSKTRAAGKTSETPRLFLSVCSRQRWCRRRASAGCLTRFLPDGWLSAREPTFAVEICPSASQLFGLFPLFVERRDGADMSLNMTFNHKTSPSLIRSGVSFQSMNSSGPVLL